MTMNFGIVSAGTFAPPIFIVARFSLQKFRFNGVTAPLPSMTGSSPLGPRTPLMVMGCATVPCLQITHFSLYAVGRQ
jgi:hypothetical protein